MEVFFLSSPTAKYSQGPLIHPLRAFSVSKCSILLYLTLWDQHNMILRGREVVPSSTKPKSVGAHLLADLTGMDEAFTSCHLHPSFGSHHPREASAQQVSPLESAGVTAWSQQEPTGGQDSRLSAPWQGAGTHHIPPAHGKAQGGEGGELGAVSPSAASDWTLTKRESTPKAG